MRRVYLDHNATAPLRPEARLAMEEELRRPAGNPSSVHREGARLRAVIGDARRNVAALLGARPHEITFTSSGTEACNLALSGTARAVPVPAPGESPTAGPRPGRIAALAIEHPAVLEPLEALASDGWSVDLIPVGASGRVQIQDVAAAIQPDTVLLACMWANNETGAVQPVHDVARLCAERGVRLFVDATQAAGRIPIDVATLPADLLAISSHKIGGPAGAGALFVREGTRLLPHVTGGGQEAGLRGGTEDSLALAGFGAAARAVRGSLGDERDAVASLREHLVGHVASEVPGARLLADGGDHLPNTAQFLVPHDDEEILILALDRAGFAVSAGSACAAGAHKASHVLAAMGVRPPGYAAVRVSLGADNTVAEIEEFARALARCVMPVSAAEVTP
jgi:cysteine desulfurase